MGTITKHYNISSLVWGSCTLNLGAVFEHLTAQEQAWRVELFLLSVQAPKL